MLHSTLQAFNLVRQRCLDRIPPGLQSAADRGLGKRIGVRQS